MAKVNVYLQFLGNSYDFSDIEKKVKEDWVQRGNKVKDLDAKIYVKVEESTIYYVVDEETFSIPL